MNGDEPGPPAIETGSRIGERIGAYRLVRELGRGGMGVVYEARHDSIGQRIAVKVLSPSSRAETNHALRLLDEARAVSIVRHEGLVKVFDFGELADGSAYLLMELLFGESLRRRLDRLASEGARLEPARALRIVRQIASAVAAAHAAAIVHRDLKPENIFLCPDSEAPGGERAKVLDFGIAKFLDAPDARTADGLILGTAAYMSPEQCTGSPVSDRADVYALGVILYELLAGRPLYRGTRSELLHWHVFQEPRPLDALHLELPDGLEALVRAMLNKVPAIRPSMSDVELQIQRFERGLRSLAPSHSTDEAEGALPSIADRRATETGSFVGSAPSPPRQDATHREGNKRRWAIAAALLAVSIPPSAWIAVRRFHSQGSPPLSSSVVPAPPAQTIPQGMALLTGGRFVMGSSAAEIDAALQWCRRLVVEECRRSLYEPEAPVRTVELSSFFLDTREVTNREFAEWLSAQPGIRVLWDRIVADATDDLLDLYPLYGTGGIVHEQGRFHVRHGYEQKPVTQVSWNAALHYCHTKNKGLPTEAEWEFAARGARGDRFPWGDDEPRCDGVVFGRRAGYACSSFGSGPADVGSAAQDRSPQGVFDLAGNVAEWVMDTYRVRYPTCEAPCRDPVVSDNTPKEGGREMHVVRGGAYYRAAEASRAAGRSHRKEGEVMGDIGFRCARSTNFANVASH